jgi:hypothetical protein
VGDIAAEYHEGGIHCPSAMNILVASQQTNILKHIAAPEMKHHCTACSQWRECAPLRNLGWICHECLRRFWGTQQIKKTGEQS